MSRVTQIPVWLALWFFIASALAIFPTAVEAAQGGKPPEITQTVQYDFESEVPGVGGVLVIRIQSEIVGSPLGELLLSGPPGTSRIGPSMGDIHLRNPLSGLYRLRVTGLQPGVYTLFLSYGKRGSSTLVSFPHVAINAGEVHDYFINFSTDGGVKIEAQRTR